MQTVGVSQSGVVTLLFTDLVDSSRLLEEFGEEEAERLRRILFSLLREAVVARGGEEVKNLGDGLMVAFGSAAAAVDAAAAMQAAVHAHNHRSGQPALQVRIGLHVGEPIRDEAITSAHPWSSPSAFAIAPRAGRSSPLLSCTSWSGGATG